jgi:antitoxin component of MazEF toxin-antitoxin module
MEIPKRSDLRIIARKNGGSLQITIPSDLASLMEIGDGTELDIDLEDKKYGKFMALWNHAAQMKEYKKQNGQRRLQ